MQKPIGILASKHYAKWQRCAIIKFDRWKCSLYERFGIEAGTKTGLAALSVWNSRCQILHARRHAVTLNVMTQARR
jgi:hypothetical protein